MSKEKALPHKPFPSHDVRVMPDSNKTEIRALRLDNPTFGMSDVRDYLDGEQAN